MNHYDSNYAANLERDDEAQIESCGFCQGSGSTPGPQYDREGRHRPEWPTRVTCEYCQGTGVVEGGSKLLPARRPTAD